MLNQSLAADIRSAALKVLSVLPLLWLRRGTILFTIFGLCFGTDCADVLRHCARLCSTSNTKITVVPSSVMHSHNCCMLAEKYSSYMDFNNDDASFQEAAYCNMYCMFECCKHEGVILYILNVTCLNLLMLISSLFKCLKMFV